MCKPSPSFATQPMQCHAGPVAAQNQLLFRKITVQNENAAVLHFSKSSQVFAACLRSSKMPQAICTELGIH